MAHTDGETLKKRLEEAWQLIETGSRYAHYKHPEVFYRVEGVGLIEATEEVAVIYTQEAGDALTFIRPLSEFLEVVDVAGVPTPRFLKA